MLIATLVILHPHHHSHRQQCRAIYNSEVVSISRGANKPMTVNIVLADVELYTAKGMRALLAKALARVSILPQSTHIRSRTARQESQALPVVSPILGQARGHAQSSLI